MIDLWFKCWAASRADYCAVCNGEKLLHVQIYQEAFETRFLESTEELYHAEGQMLIQEWEVCSRFVVFSSIHHRYFLLRWTIVLPWIIVAASIIVVVVVVVCAARLIDRKPFAACLFFCDMIGQNCDTSVIFPRFSSSFFTPWKVLNVYSVGRRHLVSSLSLFEVNHCHWLFVNDGCAR